MPQRILKTGQGAKSNAFPLTVFSSSMHPIILMILFGLTVEQTTSLCAPMEYIIHVEKRECAYCLAINTTICAGYCMTRVRGALF